MAFSIGEVGKKELERLLDGPSACSFWEPASKERRQGALYRDPRIGLTILMADSWRADQIAGPVEIRLPVLLGRTASGLLFTLHDVRVESSLHQSEIDAIWGYVGAWVTEPEPTFDNMTVWIDELPTLLGDQTFDVFATGRLRSTPPAKSAGKMVVSPQRTIRTSRHDQKAEAYRLDLQYSQPRKVKWWIEEWINPLTRLVSFCAGEPATTTKIATKINREAHGDHEHYQSLFVTGRGWPTLDMTALDPPYRKRPEPPLLSWHDSCFALKKLMRRLRSIDARLDVPFNNYLETIYANLRPHHEFLNLVQAVESLHSRTAGRYKTTAGVGSSEELLDRAKKAGLNNKDRMKIKRALEQLSPNEYSLAERLAELTAEPGLPAEPTSPPPWLEHDDPCRKLPWPSWIARARNDISHGNAPADLPWLRDQNRYLKAVVERAVLAELGLPTKHCNVASARRYEHRRH